MDTFPKLLIISHNIFEDTNNIGKTLISLLSGWPKDKLCQIYLRSEAPSLKFCDDYYQISDRDMVKSYLKGKKIVGKAFSKEDKIDIPNDDASKDQNLYNIGNKRIPLVSLIRDLIWKKKSWKNDFFKKWLDIQKPEIILFVPNDYELIYPIATFVKDYLNIPIVPYYMDDAFYFGLFVSPIDYLRRLAIRRKGKKVIEQSHTIITIGPKMADAYHDYFGKECIPLMNSVVCNDDNIKKPNNDKFTISYVGNLHSSRWKVVKEIGKAIDNNNLNAVINVYTNSFITKKIKKAFDSSNSICLCKAVSSSEVNNVLINSDALLHVESKKHKALASTMYSLSTKIPEYLNSLRPIIAYGPKNISSMEYLKDNNLAIVCINKKELNDGIKALLDKSYQVDEKRIKAFVNEHHNIEQNRLILAKILKDNYENKI